MTWYIDAWCPVDGLAFASRRQSSILHDENSEGSLDTEEIVYLCPPFFEPEQIGNLATALAATRGHFQTGFYMSQQEVAFPSLAAVIETVKRVYRGGGSSNLPGAGLPIPITPVDRPSDAATPESLVNHDLDRAWSEVQKHFHGYERAEPEDLKRSSTQFVHSARSQLVFVKLALLSVAPLLNYFAQNSATKTADFEALGRWISILARMGLMVDINLDESKVTVWNRVNDVHRLNGFEDDLPALQNSKTQLHSFQFATHPIFSQLFNIDAQQVMDTMHRIPIPVEWPSPYLSYKNSRYAFVPTFGALFCLATASHKFLQELSSPLHFAPIMMASMALSTSWAGRMRYSDSFEEVDASACDWLARSLPTFSLGKEIDDAIHWFSVYDLENKVVELAEIQP
jgi:hypothetical protein